MTTTTDRDTARTAWIIGALIENGACYDYASEYGEPGYKPDVENAPILLGDWWCRRPGCTAAGVERDGHPTFHDLGVHYPRVFAYLKTHAELVWDDEWAVVWEENTAEERALGRGDVSRAYRTEPDSYSWERSALLTEDGEWLTIHSPMSEWIAWAVNDPTRCLMSWADDDALGALGFFERECGYESGWYGVEDNPPAILEAIKLREDADVVFKLSSVEQFRVNFCVYVRDRTRWDENGNPIDADDAEDAEDVND